MSPLEIREILAIIKQYQKQIFITVASTVVVALLFTLIQRPVYEVKVPMILKGDPLTEILQQSDTLTTNIEIKKETKEIILDKYTQRFITYLQSKEYKKKLYARIDEKVRGNNWRYIYTVATDPVPLTVEVSLQANSDKAVHLLATIFKQTVAQDYAEEVTSGNAEKIELLTREIKKTMREIALIEQGLSFDARKFKHIEMGDYIKSQEEMLRMLTVEEGINNENVHSNPVVAKLRERVTELNKEVAQATDPLEKTKLKIIARDAQERYNTALYLVKTKVADGANSLAYSIKTSKIKGELEFLSKHDKDILLKVGLIKNGNQRLAEMMQVREEIKLNKPLRSVGIEEFEKVKFSNGAVNKRYRRVFVVSLALGFIFAGGIVLVLHYIGKGKVTRKDLESLGFNFLGDISTHSVDFASALRMIRTQLLHDIPEAHSAVAVVGEGAQTRAFVLALAESLRAIERKVLVIDANYRTSEETAQGLTDILSGAVPVADYVRVIQGTLLGLGKTVEAPEDVLSKKALAELLTLARAAHDYVFIISPPIGAGADALLIVQQATRVLFLIDPETNSRIELEQLLAVNRKFNANVPGAIFCHGG